MTRQYSLSICSRIAMDRDFSRTGSAAPSRRLARGRAVLTGQAVKAKSQRKFDTV